MASRFDLAIAADSRTRTAELRLLDEHGTQLFYQPADFKALSVSELQGLFDLRNYLQRYVEPTKEAAVVASVGVLIAERLLGEKVFKKLWAGEAQRSLRIRLPGATEEENPLAAALARVPWEIARPAPDAPTLAERNLAVRVVHEGAPPASQALELGKEETLRVLFVFAEARGSRPLAARKERRELLRLFEQQIYPYRRIEADFLAHGVTRERLREQIEDRGGYHIVHWSGHGHLNLLELAKAGGQQDRLTGEALLDLFTDAGGFIPQLFFLSACHSGDILRVKDWNSFLAAAQGDEPGAKEGLPEPPKDGTLPEASGFTGTAHALLAGGVPSVVAMRYEVGDEYARELALDFYDALLADSKPKSVAAALTQTRRKLRESKKHGEGRFTACDHATPLLYGESDMQLLLPQGRSPALDGHHRRLHSIAELTTAQHQHFVGRTWELAGLGTEFFGAKRGEGVKPVAGITGLGGMGKTALVAEALELWERRFEWVLLYQAKPNALSFDGTLRDIHLKLVGELGLYHGQVKQRPADAIWRQADADFTGEERVERLTRNLVRALQDEAILLVLDNFETCLKPHPEPGDTANPVWACQDPAWDRCLSRLATELQGSASRVLVTCRKPLAALADSAAHAVLLGPLPPGEAWLYVREHDGLSRMLFGTSDDERNLAFRLLEASRFHPLLMDRLARLATGGPALRPRLNEALAALESQQGFAKLPELFSAKPGDKKELAYLDDALAASIDQLLESAGPDARRLLWVISLANQPEALGLVRAVWEGKETGQRAELRQLQAMVALLPQFPPEQRAQAESLLTPELRAMLKALPPEPQQPDMEPLLAQLVAVGLVTEERDSPEDTNPNLSCHELVRERVREWMAERPDEWGDHTEESVRLAYGEHLAATFSALSQQNMSLALAAGSRAIVYCVQALAWNRLGDFASGVVTSSRDPQLLAALLPHLEAAAEAAPEGEPRWSCLTYLADALDNSGRPDLSLPFYQQAAARARAVAEAATGVGDETAQQAWRDLAWITGNWAPALLATGNPDASRQRHLESATAERLAGSPEIHALGRELEALRIDILQGKAAEALTEVEVRLARVEGWWQRHRAGQRVPEAPDPAFLARALISALDIAKNAHFAQEAWEPALRRIDAKLEMKRALGRPAEDLAMDRANRANVLSQLRRFGEAQRELEACLAVFENNPTNKAKTLSSLASLFEEQGDVAQAISLERRALALCDQLPDPSDRALSHNNLANYLKKTGRRAELDESRLHQLAALTYRLVAGLGQDLQTSFRNYIIRLRRARAAGEDFSLPRLAELLAEPAFRPLADWLRGRGVDLDELQAEIDRLLEQVREAVVPEALTPGPSPSPPTNPPGEGKTEP